MKKIFTFLIVCSTILLFSCQNSGSSASGKQATLEGKWVLKTSDESYMIFNADGTGEEKTNNGIEKYTWKKDGDKLCITKTYQIDEESEPIENGACGKFKISGNELTWKLDGLDTEIVLVKK